MVSLNLHPESQKMTKTIFKPQYRLGSRHIPSYLQRKASHHFSLYAVLKWFTRPHSCKSTLKIAQLRAECCCFMQHGWALEVQQKHRLLSPTNFPYLFLEHPEPLFQTISSTSKQYKLSRYLVKITLVRRVPLITQLWPCILPPAWPIRSTCQCEVS